MSCTQHFFNAYLCQCLPFQMITLSSLWENHSPGTGELFLEQATTGCSCGPCKATCCQLACRELRGLQYSRAYFDSCIFSNSNVMIFNQSLYILGTSWPALWPWLSCMPREGLLEVLLNFFSVTLPLHQSTKPTLQVLSKCQKAYRMALNSTWFCHLFIYQSFIIISRTQS